MTDLKPMHVETGFDVEACLKRSFNLCKKSLERERGPVTRAMEVKVETVPRLGVPERRSRTRGMPWLSVKMFL